MARIAFGGLAIDLSCAAGAVRERLVDRFGAYHRADAAPIIRATVRTEERLPAGDEVAVLGRSVRGGLAFSTGGARGRLYTAGMSLEILVAGGDPGRAAAAAENIIRPALQYAMVGREKGILVHAGCAAARGAAVIYPGVSGSGKSTLSRLIHGWGGTVYSDDLSVLVRKRGRYLACGSPFFGAAGDLPRVAGAAPLEGIFFLAGHAPTEARRLGPGRAAALLSAHAPFIGLLGRAGARRALGIIEDVTARVPAWEFRFRPLPESAGVIWTRVSGQD